MKPETKYKGSIKLSAIGDALGWITEFEKSVTSIYDKYGVEKVDRFFSWKKNVGGRFVGFVDQIRPGSYSDDTQLMLSVARSIRNDGTVDNEYFAKKELVSWLEYARGGGRTVKIAANKISRRSAKWFTNFYNHKVNGESFDYKQSGANGAAMRVLPIALANLTNVEKIKEETFCNSIITHGHPRALLGAMLYGYAVNQIIVCRVEDFSWESYLTQLGSDFSDKFALTFSDRAEVKEWLKLWNKFGYGSFEKMYSETLVETQNQLRTVFQYIKQDQPVIDTMKRLGCLDPSTKGSGTGTVVAGIYFAAKFHNSPVQAVIEAVNALGTDTDSIASFTGGLIGSLHGHNVIPDKWKNVQDFEYLNDIAERLLSVSEDRAIPITPTSRILDAKILNNAKKDDFIVNDIVEFDPLGFGRIASIERPATLTRGKYNLLAEVLLDSKQSIHYSKLFSNDSGGKQIDNQDKFDMNALLKVAESKLSESAMEELRLFIRKTKKPPKGLIDLLYNIIRNE